MKDVESCLDINRGSREGGVLVVFTDVGCTVSNRDCVSFWKKRQKEDDKIIILDGAFGVLRPGRVTFILGSSGAGKSTLLNILAGRRKIGVTGSVIGGGRGIVLVPQHTALIHTMTTQETLMFAAAVKLPNYSLHERHSAIEQVSKQLGIHNVLKTRTGKLSGGEMKRLTISCELLTDPAVMLLDEPTSGLDSVSSMSVVQALRNVAISGRTVACVIHQPPSKVYASADDVLLLANRKTLYAGAVNDVPIALGRAGFSCPQYYNVADYLLEVAAGECEGNTAQLEEEAKIYTNEMNTKAKIDITEEGHKCNNIESIALLKTKRLDPTENPNGYHSSTWTQLKTLLWRCTIVASRDLYLFYIRVLVHFLVALLLGAVYTGSGSDASRIISNTACIFFFIFFLFFANAFPTINSFPVESDIILQQHLNKWYSLPAYCIARIIADLPVQILCSTIFIIPGWWLTSQPWEAQRVALVWSIGCLVCILAQTFGLVIGAACGVKFGLFIVPAFNIPMIVFSEFFIPFKVLPGYLRPFATISYFRYIFDGFMQTVYGFNREKLDCPEPFCFFRYPQKYLDHLGLKMDIRVDILVIIVWIIIMQFSLYVVLRLRVWKACR